MFLAPLIRAPGANWYCICKQPLEQPVKHSLFSVWNILHENLYERVLYRSDCHCVVNAVFVLAIAALVYRLQLGFAIPFGVGYTSTESHTNNMIKTIIGYIEFQETNA